MSTKRRTPCMSPFSALSSNKFSTMMSSRRQTTKTEQRRGCKSVSRTRTQERTSEQVASCPCFLFTTLPSTVGITSTVCDNSASKRKTFGWQSLRSTWLLASCHTSTWTRAETCQQVTIWELDAFSSSFSLSCWASPSSPSLSCSRWLSFTFSTFGVKGPWIWWKEECHLTLNQWSAKLWKWLTMCFRIGVSRAVVIWQIVLRQGSEQSCLQLINEKTSTRRYPWKKNQYSPLVSFW